MSGGNAFSALEERVKIRHVRHLVEIIRRLATTPTVLREGRNLPVTPRRGGSLGRSSAEFPGWLPDLLTTAGLGMLLRWRGIWAGASLPLCFHPICGSQGDFNLVEFIPLGIGPLSFRDCQQLLQTTTRGNWLLFVHDGIIPLFSQNTG